MPASAPDPDREVHASLAVRREADAGASLEAGVKPGEAVPETNVRSAEP